MVRKTIIAGLLLAALLGTGTVHAALPPVVDGGKATKAAALTLEDIGSAAELEAALAFCQEQGIKVTFFFKGRDLSALPVKKAVAAGHEIGNHSLNHEYWAEVAVDSIAADLAAAARAVEAASGAPARVVRPPYNYYGENFRQAVMKLMPSPVIVRGIDAGDWLVDSPAAVAENIRQAVSGGEIININMKAKTAAAALPAIVRDLKERGYVLVTVSELLRQVPPVPHLPPVTAVGAVRVVHRVDSGRPYVALTFDDGGPAWQVAEILDVLKESGVRSTFFLLGDWVNANPELTRRIAAEGHETANHSYSHPRFSWLSAAAMREEIAAAQTALAVAGQPAVRYFRPPYGVYNSLLSGVLQELGYGALVMWDVDSRDWTGAAAATIARRVGDDTRPGSIVLFHLHGANTAAALRQLIPELQAKGYVLTTLGAMLGELKSGG